MGHSLLINTKSECLLKIFFIKYVFFTSWQTFTPPRTNTKFTHALVSRSLRIIELYPSANTTILSANCNNYRNHCDNYEQFSGLTGSRKVTHFFRLSPSKSLFTACKGAYRVKETYIIISMMTNYAISTISTNSQCLHFST